ncbi:CPBP family intramembrane glutamic endopeptidase [Edaphobacter flagellatus]|uniref:CPBP family intramembrane glutamic endopeptidase n=1 Tax=Edaphobacter flagellatus TaxID=1933044 RepID=UPI0021B29278|nr:CPBP family intramembrane glutamic endopeptidase [Edaphobacter flagellatus]
MQDNLHPDPALSIPRSTASTILFGSNGLRAGWGLLVATAIFFLIFYGTNAMLHATHLIPPHAMEHTPGPLPIFLSEGNAFLVIALVTWIMSKIERRPIAVYGLGGSRKLSNALTGAVIGLIAISLLVLLLDKAGFLIIDQRLLAGSDIPRYALLWIPGFLAIGLFEEYFFRGYMQYTITRGFAGIATRIAPRLDPRTVGFWSAAILVSFGFGAIHGSNPGESPLGLFTAGFASLVFCFSLWRTGSLWWAVGLHTAWDYGQSFIYGVADSGALFGHRLLATHPAGSPLLSGGTTGPEGSIFCLVILVALAATIHYTQPAGPQSYATRIPLPPREPAHDSGITAA